MIDANQSTSESIKQQEQQDVETAACGISPVAQSTSPSPTAATLYHYIVIRKDLPAGVALAQTVHAAGESAQNTTVPPDTHAVVLAAPDEHTLLAYEAKLLRNGLEISAIREPDEPWNGQLMAIGIKPQPREKIKRLLSNLPLYK